MGHRRAFKGLRTKADGPGAKDRSVDEANVRFRPPATLVADLGGTWMRAATVDDGGRLSARTEAPTPRSGPLTPVLNLLRHCRTPEVDHVVVAVNGMVDYRDGVIVGSSMLPIEWHATLTEHALSERLQLPVSIVNDADLAAVGEAWFGAAQGVSDVAYLTLSTGVGAAALVGGELLHGRRSLAELGETIIDLSCAVLTDCTVEALASGTALKRRAKELGIVSDSGPELERSWRAGDRRSAEAWNTTLEAAAIATANLAWMFAPDLIVVGGGLGLVGDPVIEALQARVSSVGPPCKSRVVVAALGPHAALVGAAAWKRAFNPLRAGRSTA